MPSSRFPYQIARLSEPTVTLIELFVRKFGSPPPQDGIHFVARRDHGHANVSAYVHYYEHESGVFLCGGLCVDVRDYRHLSSEERRRVAAAGSLSRWLSVTSISDLPSKRAIFAYTGDTRSRRDAFAIDFEVAIRPHLLVQWHAEPPASRAALVGRIHRLGPF